MLGQTFDLYSILLIGGGDLQGSRSPDVSTAAYTFDPLRRYAPQ